jgi:hypothetical protein
MQGWNRECGKKVKKQKYLKNIYVCCVKIWQDKSDWLSGGLNNKIKEWCGMQGWNNECGKKGKKEKYMKYIYVCCVKI